MTTTYHVDQNIERTLPSLDQLGSVVLLPAPSFVILLPKVSAKRLLTPRRIDRVGDGREGGHRFVLAWILQELRARGISMTVYRWASWWIPGIAWE